MGKRSTATGTTLTGASPRTKSRKHCLPSFATFVKPSIGNCSPITICRSHQWTRGTVHRWRACSYACKPKDVTHGTGPKEPPKVSIVRHRLEDLDFRSQTVGEIEAQLKRTRNFVILGEPGSGKSTLFALLGRRMRDRWPRISTAFLEPSRLRHPQRGANRRARPAVCGKRTAIGHGGRLFRSGIIHRALLSLPRRPG